MIKLSESPPSVVGKRLVLHLVLVTTLLEQVWTQRSAGGVSKEYIEELEYEWSVVDYVWPSRTDQQRSLQNKSFIPENNALAGIKVLGHRVFVTVPRWKLGVPSTLNELQLQGEREDGGPSSPPLQPFPSWAMQRIGDCHAFQYVQSMEIVPSTRQMWVIDVGRIDILGSKPLNVCPPKLSIVDVDSGKVVDTHVFPEEVVSKTSNFLNDIVVDPGRRTAYISNVGEQTIVVVDMERGTSHKIHHPSMKNNLRSFRIGKEEFNNPIGVDGVALSPDFSTLFYCALTSRDLHSIPTHTLRSPHLTPLLFNASYRYCGSKDYPSDGMIMGEENLYFGALDHNGVYRWRVTQDMETGQTNYFWNTSIISVPKLLRRHGGLKWPDTFAIDNNSNLLVLTNTLPRFFDGTMDFSGRNGTNFRIYKVQIGEKSYLANYRNISSRNSPSHSLGTDTYATMFLTGFGLILVHYSNAIL